MKRLLTLLVAYVCACVTGGLVLGSPLLSWMLAIAWDTAKGWLWPRLPATPS